MPPLRSSLLPRIVSYASYSNIFLPNRGADKSLARPTSRCILFDGENISFDVSLVMYTNSINIPPIMIINRMYEIQNLLSLKLFPFLVGQRIYQQKPFPVYHFLIVRSQSITPIEQEVGYNHTFCNLYIFTQEKGGEKIPNLNCNKIFQISSHLYTYNFYCVHVIPK